MAKAADCCTLLYGKNICSAWTVGEASFSSFLLHILMKTSIQSNYNTPSSTITDFEHNCASFRLSLFSKSLNDFRHCRDYTNEMLWDYSLCPLSSTSLIKPSVTPFETQTLADSSTCMNYLKIAIFQVCCYRSPTQAKMVSFKGSYFNSEC